MRNRPAHLISAAVAAIAFSCSGNGNVCCTDIDIRLTDTLMVDAATVRNLVVENYGCCLGENLDSIALGEIENILDSCGSIRKSEVWTTRGGILHIKVEGRRPVMCFVSGGRRLYADAEGVIFPYDGDCPEGIPCLKGSVPIEIPAGFIGIPEDENGRRWLAAMTELLAHDISDIEIKDGGEIFFKLREMPETFIFGRPEGITEKFARIDKYIQTIRPLDKGYKYVNVKYNGQIICRKDI